MTSGMLIQAIVNGLNIGVVYALLALGLTLLFGIMEILFFAHGAMFMFGAYVAYYLTVGVGLNYFLAGIAAIVVIGFFGVLVEKVLFRPIRGQMMAVFFVAISLNWFLESVGLISFGVKGKRIPTVFEGSLEFLGASVTWERVAVVLIGLVAVAALHLFLTRSKWGLQMRAFAEDPETAELQGISQDFVCTLGFFIGCGLAALAGFLVAPVFLVSPIMGGHAVLTGLLVIAIGGLGSIPGALIGALVIGFIESFGATFIGPRFTWGPVFIFAFAFLLIRPTGFLGHKE
ncbi:MAG: branched-chain amino acid ABC transporter permease [Deltaproteobacteria bacterium]|nr:branched-chain amino acid ABC transporter permease [Deltaproteobacteria bacterium]